MESEEKQFYILLTIFGAMLGIGPFIIFEAAGVGQFTGGCIVTLFGLVGLMMLWDKFRLWVAVAASRLRVRIPLKLMGVIGVWIILAVFLSYLHNLRSNFDDYVMPRTLTSKQASDLVEALRHQQPFPVTVKVAVHDSEAMQYAGQIFAAFKQADWDDTNFRTTEKVDTEAPYTLNDGLCIDVAGEWKKPPDPNPKHNPQQILQDAFQSANIVVNCSGGMGAGEPNLFVLVGHRPLKLQELQQNSFRLKFAHWIERLGQ